MRRRAPRSLASVLEDVRAELAPATTLAQLQERWEGAVGPVVSAEASPVSERSGVVTVACHSAVWAQELALMGAELLASINAALERPDAPPRVRELRFVMRSA